MGFKLLTLAGLVMALNACVYTGPVTDRAESHIVGTPLKDISSLTTESGSDRNKVAIFDPTIQKIHQFDLSTMTHERTLQPTVPGGKHFVLYDPTGNYVIDMTAKHLSIFNKAGKVNDQPVSFQGNPVSGAFRPSLGLLVIYDDKQSVAMLQLDGEGNVSKSWVGGPVVNGDFTISAGDIDDQGNLILALSNDSLVSVNLVKAMTDRQWPVAPSLFATGLQGISWLAPVHDRAGQFLVMSSSQIALVDLSGKSVLASQAISRAQTVVKTSKNFDPHILLASGHEVDLVYAQAGQLHVRATYYRGEHPLSSRLNLVNDSWSVVDSKAPQGIVGSWNGYVWVFQDDINSYKHQRQVSVYQASNFLALNSLDIPDDAQLEVTEHNVLELFPAKFGFAVNVSLSTGQSSQIRYFNIPYAH